MKKKKKCSWCRLDVGNKKNRGKRKRERERGEEDERHGSPNTVCSFRVGGPCNLFANSGYCGTAGQPSAFSCQQVFRSLLCLSVSLFQNFPDSILVSEK